MTKAPRAILLLIWAACGDLRRDKLCHPMQARPAASLALHLRRHVPLLEVGVVQGSGAESHRTTGLDGAAHAAIRLELGLIDEALVAKDRTHVVREPEVIIAS
jgi:hypothetical protein